MPDTSPFVLTPALFEQYYVVRPTNLWSEVQMARDKLRDLQTSYEDMEKDKDKVVTYVNVLKRSGRLLAGAICVAAHLRRYSQAPSATQRFTDGLSALSVGLGLQSLDESVRGLEIERCVREIGVQPEDLPTLEIGNNSSPSQSAAWRQKIEKLLEDVNRTRLPESSDVLRDAWAAWDSRLFSFRLHNPQPPIDINYLRCRAQGSPPGQILPARLDTVTLGAVSDALTTALASSTVSRAYPNTFVLGLLAALGFDLSSELTPRISDDSVTQFLKRSATGINPQTPTQGLLVLRLPVGSLTASWKIDPTMPTLNTTSDAWQNLFNGNFDLKRYLTARLQGILFEVDKSQPLRDEVSRCEKELKKMRDYLSTTKAGLLVSRPITDLNSLPVELRRPVVAPPNQADAAKQIS
jgi:hypothetical protein